eukprot:NODE_2507_length_685_cov_20.735849_g2050_i0.p2 GENE.NODE_2507_length_685_cov_20.735849_g2050_i0~~NODE_2507_length_685_cov_20.735849_g2050_i0.p2  ORF type:complete len:90 (+),score=18.19 NODE_2507_length_685_cov_20.735849_g2050_i0:191-460(+)
MEVCVPHTKSCGDEDMLMDGMDWICSWSTDTYPGMVINGMRVCVCVTWTCMGISSSRASRISIDPFGTQTQAQTHKTATTTEHSQQADE